jgi:hypothetical protein
MIDVLKDLQNRIDRTNRLLGRLEQAMQCAKRGDYKYRVTIVSAWHEHGEKNGVGEGDTLEEATKAAEDRFREINERDDIHEATRTYTVVFPSVDGGFTMSPHMFH